MTQIIIRADASSDIGGGHIYRCLTLAQAIKKQVPKTRIEFITQPAKGKLDHLIEQQGFAITNVKQMNDAKEVRKILIERIKQHGPIQWLIVDHYQINIHWQRQLIPLCQQLMVIDDLANRGHYCDLLFDQSLGRQSNEYLPWLEKNQTEIICGAANALLREEFSHWRNQAQQKRQQTTRINKVLIAISATDPSNESGKIINQLEQQNPIQAPNWQYTLVLTSQAKHLASIKQQVETSPLDIKLLLDVTNMAELIYQSDIAIAAAGTAMLERCSLGLPSIVICIADNQRHIAQALATKKAAIAVFDHSETEKRLLLALKQINDDIGQYQTIANNAFKLCHTDGAERLAGRLINKTTNNLWLKPVTLDDCEQLYQWQCAPQTRQYSRNPEPPTWPQHQIWFNQIHNDQTINFYLLMQNTTPSGYLRLHPKQIKETSGKEVSIALAPSAYGQGLGHKGLKLLAQLHRQDKLFAYIDNNNIASVKAFTKANYHSIGDNWYQLKH